MKKLLAILLVISIVVAFAACSSKEYKEVAVTAPVTNEAGEPVTNADGTVVTEVVTDESGKHLTETVQSNTDADDTVVGTTKGSKNTTSKKSEATTKKSSSKKDETSGAKEPTSGKNDTTSKKETTTKETTTEKPKKRDVTVDILIPYINLDKAELKVKYAYKKDNGETVTQYYEFDDPDKKFGKLDYKAVTMDGKTVVTCVLENIKGNVTVRCELFDIDTSKNVELSDNVIKIGAYEDEGTIKPYSGIENLIGEDL